MDDENTTRPLPRGQGSARTAASGSQPRSIDDQPGATRAPWTTVAHVCEAWTGVPGTVNCTACADYHDWVEECIHGPSGAFGPGRRARPDRRSSPIDPRKRQVSARNYGAAMPEVSRFFGIVIQMYAEDHLPPHFHARQGGKEVVVAIDSLAIIRGRLSPRAHALVVEWAALHADELRADWQLAQAGLPLNRIAPLR